MEKRNPNVGTADTRPEAGAPKGKARPRQPTGTIVRSTQQKTGGGSENTTTALNPEREEETDVLPMCMELSAE